MLLSHIGLVLSQVMTAMQMQYMLRNDICTFRVPEPNTDRVMSDQPHKLNRGLPHNLYRAAEIVLFVQVPMPTAFPSRPDQR